MSFSSVSNDSRNGLNFDQVLRFSSVYDSAGRRLTVIYRHNVLFFSQNFLVMSLSFLSFQSEFVSKVGDSGGGMYTVSILEILRMWNNTVTDEEMFTHISVILFIFFSIESGVVTLKYAFMAKKFKQKLSGSCSVILSFSRAQISVWK